MRVVDVRDFCIPSDENDYDELVAFADTMAAIPQFDAVPIDVFDKIRTEIEKQKNERCFDDNDMFVYRTGLDDALYIIDKYKKESK